MVNKTAEFDDLEDDDDNNMENVNDFEQSQNLCFFLSCQTLKHKYEHLPFYYKYINYLIFTTGN